MTDATFTFEGCYSPDVCRDGIRPLLAAGMDWSEVQCGRCGQRGIVRHADLLPATAAPATPDADGSPLEVLPPAEPDPASLPEDIEPASEPAETGRAKR